MIRDTVDVAGVRIDRLTMEQSMDEATHLILSGKTHQHVVVNAAKLVSAVENPEVRDAINKCSLINADGQSVVWASRILGDPLPERVAGIDFMNGLVDLSAAKGFSIYLLGAEKQVVETVSQIFMARGANVVGCQHGFWRTEKTDDQLVAEISSLGPNILFVAVPSPMKELFLAKNLHALGTNLCVGVGGSFDVVAGKTKRAPAFVQHLGLEWAFRLAQEPRRMFKRYLIGNARMVKIVFSEWRRNRGA